MAGQPAEVCGLVSRDPVDPQSLRGEELQLWSDPEDHPSVHPSAPRPSAEPFEQAKARWTRGEEEGQGLGRPGPRRPATAFCRAAVSRKGTVAGAEGGPALPTGQESGSGRRAGPRHHVRASPARLEGLASRGPGSSDRDGGLPGFARARSPKKVGGSGGPSPMSASRSADAHWAGPIGRALRPWVLHPGVTRRQLGSARPDLRPLAQETMLCT